MPFNDLPLIAGSASTLIFVASYLPMLLKAVRTKDLTSYSPTNLLLANLGNAVHSVYVYSLPIGPIWVLHSFYVVTSALMFVWYLRFTRSARRRAQVGQSLPDRLSRIGDTRPIAPIAMGAGRLLRVAMQAQWLGGFPRDDALRLEIEDTYLGSSPLYMPATGEAPHHCRHSQRLALRRFRRGMPSASSPSTHPSRWSDPSPLPAQTSSTDKATTFFPWQTTSIA
jgi:uncharacterized protein with PQ loop repeat